MNLKQLRTLVKRSESSKLEFKASTAQLRSAFETICAFLNGQGGIVLLGVNNKGELIGQDVTDNTRQEVARELNRIEPVAQIDVHYIPLMTKKYIIAVKAIAGCHAPYVYDGRAFQRNQSTTIRMSQHYYEQLLVKRGQLNHSWEELIASNYNINDLDHDEIHRTLQEAIQVNRVPLDAIADNIVATLERLELIKQGKLKNAAVVLFGKKLFPTYMQCMLKMGRFKGEDHLGDLIDNQQIYGNIFFLLSEADYFIKRHLPMASFFHTNQLERTDQLALPALALREALVNAVCHRDYSERSGAITLSIFDDRMEIWNFGVLPSTLKLSDLKRKHKSFPRNRLIANVLYSRKFFERWGSGTNKMVDLCRHQNIPEPVFEEYSDGFSVTFTFRESIGVSSRAPSISETFLNVRQEEVLQILYNGKILSANEIFSKLQKPLSLRTLKADLQVLQKLGLIEKQGKGRNTVWKVKSHD